MENAGFVRRLAKNGWNETEEAERTRNYRNVFSSSKQLLYLPVCIYPGVDEKC